jgi:hypothetical protein
MFPTEPYVRGVIGPYEPELCQLIRRSWKRVTENPDRASFDLKRMVATFMHQMLMNEVRATYTDTPDVRLLEAHETIRLLIEKTLLVRLKKMNRRGYARNHSSQATLAFTNVITPLPFALVELPEVYTVDVGYVLNDLETKIDLILVAARFGESVLWSYQADEGAMEATATIITVPPVAPSSATIIKLPVPDRTDKKDKTDKDDERK